MHCHQYWCSCHLLPCHVAQHLLPLIPHPPNDCAEPSEDEECREDDEDDKFETPVVDMIVHLSNDKQLQTSSTSILNEISAY